MTMELVGGFVSLVVYMVMMFGVYKVLQIATDMGEIKELLRDIRRNTDTNAPVPPPSLPVSAESLVRAVHSASYSEIIDQAVATHSEPQR